MILIDREKAIKNIEDIVTTVSVCSTSEEARGMARMKERVIESLMEENEVKAIPIEWIFDRAVRKQD